MQRARALEHTSGAGMLRCYVDRTCTSRNASMENPAVPEVVARLGVSSCDALPHRGGCHASCATPEHTVHFHATTATSERVGSRVALQRRKLEELERFVMDPCCSQLCFSRYCCTLSGNGGEALDRWSLYYTIDVLIPSLLALIPPAQREYMKKVRSPVRLANTSAA